MPTPVRAFGLDLAATFKLPGRHGSAPDAQPQRPVALDLVPSADLRGTWPAATHRLIDQVRPDGRVFHRIEAHDELGYRFTAMGWGTFVIDQGGGRVRCAPRRAAAWRWQRYLVGQVLPFVAVVHGLEVLHASAVARDGRVSVFVGASEAGKSSVAVALLLRGWELIADDVVTLEALPGLAPILHPGAGLASVRWPTVGALGEDALTALGREIGRDEEAIRLAVPVDATPRSIDAVYVLDRRSEADALGIEPLEPVDPRLLLSATFNLSLRTPERMLRQLDVCADLARHVAVARIHMPSGCGPAAVAAAVESLRGR